MLFVILFFLSSILHCQDLNFSISVENDIYQNKIFEYKILPSKSVKPEDIAQITQPPLPPNLYVLSGPEYIKDNDGLVKYITYKMLAKASKMFQIDEFSIKLKIGKTIDTKKKQITVYPSVENILNPTLKWNIFDDKIYQNQTIFAYLTIENLEKEDIKIENITLDNINNAIIEEKSITLARTESKTVNGKSFYSIPIAQYLLTITSNQTFELPEVNVKIYVNGKALDIKTEKKQISVFELPPAVNKNMAVGDFDFKVEFENKDIILGQKFDIKLRVSGQGNLKFLSLPKPEYGNSFILNETKEKLVVIPNQKGYSGFREIVYTFTPAKEDKSVIVIPSFTFLNYLDYLKEIQAKTLEVNVFSFAKKEDSSLDRFSFKFIGKSKINQNSFLYDLKHYYHYSFVFFVVLFFILKRIGNRKLLILIAFSFIFLTGFKFKESKKGYDKVLTLIDEQKYLEAVRENLKILKDNKTSNKYYNLAILLLKENQLRYSISFLLSSLSFDNYNKDSFHALISIMDFLKLKGVDDIKYIFLIQKSILISKIIVINFFYLFLFLSFFYKKRSILYYFAIPFFLIYLCIIIFDKNQDIDFNKLYLIKNEDIILNNIPSINSTQKYKLNTIEIVSIYSGENKEFFYVKTFENINGWIYKDYIINSKSEFKKLSNDISKLLEDKKDLTDGLKIKQTVEYKEEKLKIDIQSIQTPSELTSIDGMIKISPLPFSPDKDGNNDELNIETFFKDKDNIKSWSISITDPKKYPFKTIKGKGTPPSSIIWNGLSDTGELVQSNTEYSLNLKVVLESKKETQTDLRLPVDILLEEREGKLFMRVSSIIFPPDSSDLTATSQDQKKKNDITIDKLAITLAKYPSYSILILGYANLTNFLDDNKAKIEQDNELKPLSLDRAQAVKNELVKRGLNGNRIKVDGLGATDPVVQYNDYANNWKNRRVEFILNKN